MANSNNFFTDKNAIKTIDLFRIIYLVIAVFAFLITEAGRNIYRPFIYENAINDFGIADSIGNSGRNYRSNIFHVSYYKFTEK
jgi:hypothetical protein